MSILSVNLNKIALLRNSRGRDFPDPLAFGRLALQAGAGGLTVHPRPDQRHARYDDMQPLCDLVAEYAGAELNIEGYPAPALLERVWQVRPHQLTLVPDAPDQLTSDHGWTVSAHESLLSEVIQQAHEYGIRVSLFMDDDLDEISAAQKLGADRVELRTETFARACAQTEAAGRREAALLAMVADEARDLGLGINAGHDLNLDNVALLCELVRPDEVSIGHALTVEALLGGWTHTVERYVEILAQFGSDDCF